MKNTATHSTFSTFFQSVREALSRMVHAFDSPSTREFRRLKDFIAD